MSGRDFVELINQKPHNTEAFYAQVVAYEALEGEAACTNCFAGDGLYTVCFRLPGQHHCANCHHGRQQGRCSLRPATSLGAGENPPLQGTERVSEATEAGNREIAKKIGDLLQEEEKELARLHDMIAKKEDLIQTLKAIQKSLGVSSRLQ